MRVRQCNSGVFRVSGSILFWRRKFKSARWPIGLGTPATARASIYSTEASVMALHRGSSAARPLRKSSSPKVRSISRRFGVRACDGVRLSLILLLGITVSSLCAAQDDPLNKVHVPPPVSTTAPTTTTPAQPAPVEGPDALKARAGERIRVDVDLVLVPLTVTDPLNRLVTGLDKDNFSLFENNYPQTIRTFSSEDAPVSIGVIMDLSGSMTNKVIRSRESIVQFMKTANPQDEFFVIGFNDRPELLEDFTSSVDDIEARLEMVKAGHHCATRCDLFRPRENEAGEVS